jgi:AMMECR1 domain-containing protein
MGSSVLLKLARDSMLEVYQAKYIIDKNELLKQHPILDSKIECTINIYLNDNLKSSYSTNSNNSLLQNIIIASKKAAFEDNNSTPLKTSEYLECEVELILHTDEGDISQKDTPILKNDNEALSFL